MDKWFTRSGWRTHCMLALWTDLRLGLCFYLLAVMVAFRIQDVMLLLLGERIRSEWYFKKKIHAKGANVCTHLDLESLQERRTLIAFHNLCNWSEICLLYLALKLKDVMLSDFEPQSLLASTGPQALPHPQHVANIIKEDVVSIKVRFVDRLTIFHKVKG